jgi:uncharacterized protein YggE
MKHPLTAWALILFMFISPTPFAVAGDGGSFDDLPKLSVRGEAILNVPADQLRLNIGVVTDAAAADVALDQNSAKIKEVIKAMERVGLSKDDYRTSQFQIQPRWSPRPRQAPQDWRPHIVGYTVTNSLSIKTTKLNLAGKIIGAASGSGANQINSIIFDLADPRAYRAKAIETATAHAMADARSLALSASVRLVKILSLNLENVAAQPIRMQVESFNRMAATAAAEPPISSGDVTVRASVHLIYQIEQKE